MAAVCGERTCSKWMVWPSMVVVVVVVVVVNCECRSSSASCLRQS
jgi:hypothetical protein